MPMFKEASRFSHDRAERWLDPAIVALQSTKTEWRQEQSAIARINDHEKIVRRDPEERRYIDLVSHIMQETAFAPYTVESTARRLRCAYAPRV